MLGGMRLVGTRVLALVRSCHPEPTVAVTAMATALAVTTGRGAVGVLLVAGAVLTGQLSIGWLNDRLDADRDRAVGRADKPVAGGAVPTRAVAVAAVVAAVLCVPLSLASGLLAGALHLVAVAGGLAYDLGLKATRASVLPYALSFGLLPVFVVLGAGGAVPWWLPTAGALLGSGAHFANALPDLDDDRATGVLGLPHRLGAAGSRIAAAALLLAASVVLGVGVVMAGAPVPAPLVVAAPLVAAAVLGVGFARGRRPGSRAPFRAVILVALVDVALLLAAGPALVSPG
jgi:4-hydroxybenzoate polyprenyltransferase